MKREKVIEIERERMKKYFFLWREYTINSQMYKVAAALSNEMLFGLFSFARSRKTTTFMAINSERLTLWSKLYILYGSIDDMAVIFCVLLLQHLCDLSQLAGKKNYAYEMRFEITKSQRCYIHKSQSLWNMKIKQQKLFNIWESM